MSYLFPSKTFHDALAQVATFERQPTSAKSKLSTSSRKDKVNRAFIQRVHQLIIDNIENETLSAQDLCSAMHLSYSQFYRRIKAQTGQKPCLLIRSIRLQQAKQLLETTYLNVSEIAYQVGFNDPNYFSRAFKKAYGISPSEV